MKHVFRRFIPGMILILFACAEAPDMQNTVLVRTMAKKLIDVAELPGLSIAVSKNGEIVFAEGFGYADVERELPVTTDTRFRAASVSKMMAATAVGKLVQDGTLDLDAPVQKYVSGFPEKEWPITSRQLAGHIGGIPHYSNNDTYKAGHYSTMDEALGVFSAGELQFEPGTDYIYSTHGFTLLSAVIEGSSGETFLDYLHEAVFKPLGMEATGPDMAPADAQYVDGDRPYYRPVERSDVVSFYELTDDGRIKQEWIEDPSYKWAAGGMLTTTSDLVRLAEGYFNGFLTSETVDLLFTSQTLASGEDTGVGVGWRNSHDFAGRRVMEHAGGMEGARSVLCIYPEEHLAIAVMTNTSWSSRVEETAHVLASLFLPEPEPQPQPDGSATITGMLYPYSGDRAESRWEGTLSLNAGVGELVFDSGILDGNVYSLLTLGRGDEYALIYPEGIAHATMRFRDDSVTGNVISYWSLQSEKPDTPFLTFTGSYAKN